MESLDLLWMTITTVHDIVKAHKELADAVQELGDTVQLLSIAVKPLTEKTSNDSDEVQQVLKPFKQVLMDANKLLTQLMDEKKPSSRFNMIFNLFRPQSYIEEIKNYHDKLKTMTPILTLAINSKMHRNGHTDVTHNFSATKFLKNSSFWVTHFGDTAFKIDWNRFCSAFEYQFVKDKKNFSASTLKSALDKNNDGEVDIYEYDLLFRERDPWEVYLEISSVPAIEVTESRKRKVEENSSDDVLIKKLKEVDKEVTSSPIMYRLVLFGKDEIINQDVFKDLLVVQQRWHEKPFEVGRAFFIDIPSNYVVRISRTHFQIECRTNDGVKEYFITDMSGNGTYLNGKLIGKEKSLKLEHGDKIGILCEKPSFQVEFGYIFKLEGKEEDNNNNATSKSTAV